MPDLVVDGLDASYGAMRALFGVSLALDRGETVALIGANGAGKSTLLKCLVGLLPCARKMVQLRGEAIGGLPADRIVARGLTLVPEGRRLFADLTVEENLRIGAQVGRKGPWTLEAVYELLPALKQRRRHLAPQISGGQQQMVAIGRALMGNPDILLFDEISLGLAPIVVEEIYAAFPRVIGRETGVILVEQDISRALAVSHRYLCLREGRIVLEGSSRTADREAINSAYFGADA